LAIPAAVLRRFYLTRSLRNVDGGFEFKLKNVVAPATFLSVGPIEVDGAPFAPDQVMLVASKPRRASSVNDKSPYELRMGKEVSVCVRGDTLRAGEHLVSLHGVTREVGPVVIEFAESV
jgi:hypothetical protein